MDEVFLGFRYQGGVDMTVIGFSKENKTYLPVIELFRELYINVHYETNTNSVGGFYIRQNVPYSIDFENFIARVGNKTYSLNQDDFYIGEADVYLEREVFFRIFDLDFTVDYSYLILRLVANQKLPIVIRSERERERARRQGRTRYVSEYPLLLPRNPQVLNGYFLDYSLSQQYESGRVSNSSALFTFGNETMYGDVQGNFRLNQSINQDPIHDFGSVRYRYVWSDNSIATQFLFGQLQSQSGSSGAFTGFRLNNTPLFQDREFDELLIDQQTIPNSEIEVYSNNRLVDVILSDDLGNFKIAVPITYGMNEVKVSIFGPNGEMIESDRRIDIPFNFIPKGEFRYSVSAGRREKPDFFTADRPLLAHAEMSFAPASNYTTVLETEFISNRGESDVILTSQNSFRLFNSLLMQIDLAPGHRYRAESYYQSIFGSYIRGYTGWNNENSITNSIGLKRNYGGSAFIPINILPTSLSTRLTWDKSVYETFNVLNTTLELNTRIRRISLRGGYRQSHRMNFLSNTTSIFRRYVITSSYTIPPSRNYWLPFRGLFLRTQLDFNNNLNQLEQVDFSMSRRVGENGRMQFSWLHNVPGGYNSYFLSFSIDFNFFRWSSSARYVRDSRSVVRQSIRGSVTYDRPNQMFWFDNRQQVGRSAVSAVLFVDVDGDGVFSEGDERIDDNALRVLGAGSRVKSKNGITAITQLQQYKQYDVEINEGAIRNPSLVPVLDKFSIVTDPNQHKTIQIPFERTGVLDGGVTRDREGRTEGVSGLRLNLREESGKYESVVRTFNDGSFYQFEVPPGNYIMTIDTMQLGILRSRSIPDTIRFTMRSLPDGDFIEGLQFKIESLAAPVIPVIPVTPPAIVEKPQYFRIQTAMMTTLARAIMAKLEIEEQTGVVHEIQYSRRWDNYRVFSTEIEGLDKALAAINALRKTQFSDAFIISEQIFATEDVFYAIQVGAFTDSLGAVQHISDIKALYGLDGHILYDAIINHYKVILEPMSNFLTASAERDRVRAETDLDDAFLITQPNVNSRDIDFSVQFATFNSQAEAYQLSQRLTNRVGIQNYVVQIGNTYYVRSKPTNRLEDAVELYRRVRTLGYSDAIIHTYRS